MVPLMHSLDGVDSADSMFLVGLLRILLGWGISLCAVKDDARSTQSGRQLSRMVVCSPGGADTPLLVTSKRDSALSILLLLADSLPTCVLNVILG